MGRHTGRQRRDTEEEGLQQDEGAEQGEASQHMGLQQTGVQQTGLQQTGLQQTGLQQTGLQQTGVQQTGLQQTGLQQTGVQQTGLQQTGTQQACWQGEELLQAGWQQGLDSQFTGAQMRVRRGAGAQQLGAQQVGSQQVSWQSSTCQEEPMQALGELTWLPQLKSLEQTDKVDAATTQVLEQQVSAMLGVCAERCSSWGCDWWVSEVLWALGLLYPSLGCSASPEAQQTFLFLVTAQRMFPDEVISVFTVRCFGEGNGNPLQCSCLENPRDRGAWWAAVYGVAQSRTRLKQLSSSSSSEMFITLSLRLLMTGGVFVS